MRKQRYAVRFYVSRKGKGIAIGGLYNPRTGKHTLIYSHPTQYHYTGNTLTEALSKGMAYLPDGNWLTSYTVTDRVKGKKYNVSLDN